MPEIRLPRFVDAHVHVRQDAMLCVTRHSLRYCDHILVMPNTVPPICTAAEALDYQNRIVEHVLDRDRESIHMTCKLLDTTDPASIKPMVDAGVAAVKLYPANATTNSADGVTDIRALAPVFEEMQQHDLVLCLHGELPGAHPYHTVLEWEQDFVDQQFEWIIRSFPKLRVVLEHVSTKRAVEAVRAAREGVAATITAHHLLITIDDVLAYGLEPRNYCKPIAKYPRDQEALRWAAFDGGAKFFLGSDSAPHPRDKKFGDCGCAGCFTAPILPQLVLTAYAACGHSRGYQDLREFVAYRAAGFYNWKLSGHEIALAPYHKQSPISREIDGIPVFWGGRQLGWRLVSY